MIQLSHELIHINSGTSRLEWQESLLDEARVALIQSQLSATWNLRSFSFWVSFHFQYLFHSPFSLLSYFYCFYFSIYLIFESRYQEFFWEFTHPAQNETFASFYFDPSWVFGPWKDLFRGCFWRFLGRVPLMRLCVN